jgi:hypothetical protein
MQLEPMFAAALGALYVYGVLSAHAIVLIGLFVWLLFGTSDTDGHLLEAAD